MTRAVLRLWPSAFIGALIGLLAIPLGQLIAAVVTANFDAAFPVLRATHTIVSKTDTEVVVSISVEKLREGQYVRLQAFGDRGAELIDLNIARVDTVEQGDTRPTGRYYIGTWRIWPLTSTQRILVYANHICDGRVVVSLVAEVLV